MLLQLALDVLSLPEALTLTEKVRDHVDIIEIGTPFLLEEGLGAVRAFRECFPDKKILADAKIADAGAYEAGQCFRAGADYVTVLGVCDLLTIAESVQTAKDYGGRIVTDMICVPDLTKRVAELLDIGVQDIAVHTGIDQQNVGRTPLADLKEIRACAGDAQVAVAGGITLDTVEQYRQAGADIVICGGAIAKAPDPARAAADLAQKIHGETK